MGSGTRDGRRAVHAQTIALLALLAIVLAACGAGETTAGETPEAPSPAEEDTDPAPPPPEEDEDSAPEEPAPREVREVTLLLPLPVLTIAMFPAVVAEHQGFFEEEGLDVNVTPSGSSSLAVQQMAAGGGEAGLLIAGSFLNAVAQGQDFVAVHDFILRPVFDVLVPADSPIETYEDLAGARIGIGRLAGGELPELRGDLASVGLEEGSDYNLVVLGEDAATAFQQVLNGRADAHALSYNDQVAVRAAGLEFRRLDPPYDLEEARPAVPLAVTRALLDSDPDAVVGLGRALNKAIVFAHENPDATLAIMREAFPPEHGNEEFARDYLGTALEFSDPEAPTVTSGRYGEMPLEGWRQLAELLLGDDANDLDLEAHVTNDYIEQMNDFDVEAVREQATNSGLTYP